MHLNNSKINIYNIPPDNIIKPEYYNDYEASVDALWGQIVNLAALGHGLLEIRRQIVQRPRLGDADLRRLLGQRILRAHPDDVIHVKVVPEQNLLPAVRIDHRRQSGSVDAEIVEERAVLSEGVRIGRIIHRALLVPREQENPRIKLFPQSISPFNVCALLKHDVFLSKE